MTHTVRNLGNLRRQDRKGSTEDGTRMPDLPELLSGNAVTVSADVEGVLPASWDTATVRVDPVAPPGDQNLPLRAAEASDASVDRQPWPAGSAWWPRYGPGRPR